MATYEMIEPAYNPDGTMTWKDGTTSYRGATLDQSNLGKGTPMQTAIGRPNAAPADQGGATFGGPTTPFAPSGIVGGTMTQASGAAASTVSPWNVNSNQTVQSQAEGIIGRDGGLMQQARGGAYQGANERGLINSSLAVGAAQDAVMGKALDIARPDAATYADSAKANAAASNTSSMYNAGQANSYNIAQQELTQRNAHFQDTLKIQQADQALKASGQAFDQGHKTSLQTFEQDYKNRSLNQSGSQFLADLNSRTQTAQLDRDDRGFNSEYQAYTRHISAIDADPNLSAEAKVQMKNNAQQNLKDYVTIRGLKLDLNFGVPTQTPATQAATAAAAAVAASGGSGVGTAQSYDSGA